MDALVFRARLFEYLGYGLVVICAGIVAGLLVWVFRECWPTAKRRAGLTASWSVIAVVVVAAELVVVWWLFQAAATRDLAFPPAQPPELPLAADPLELVLVLEPGSVIRLREEGFTFDEFRDRLEYFAREMKSEGVPPESCEFAIRCQPNVPVGEVIRLISLLQEYQFSSFHVATDQSSSK